MNTHIYKLTKDDSSFILIGTGHSFQLNILPEVVQNILLNQQTLLLETIHPKLNLENLTKMGYFNGDTPEIANWYADLSATEKQQLQTKTTLFKQKHSVNFDDSKLSMRGAVACIFECAFIGMDQQLIEHARTHNKKLVPLRPRINHLEPLESENGIFGINSIPDFKKYLLQFSTEVRELTEKEKQKYLLGVPYTLNDCDEEEKDEIASDNRRFFRLTERELNSDKANILLAVGTNHLYTDIGLLNLFKQSGYKIKRFNEKGDLFDYNSAEKARPKKPR